MEIKTGWATAGGGLLRILVTLTVRHRLIGRLRIYWPQQRSNTNTNTSTNCSYRPFLSATTSHLGRWTPYLPWRNSKTFVCRFPLTILFCTNTFFSPAKFCTEQQQNVTAKNNQKKTRGKKTEKTRKQENKKPKCEKWTPTVDRETIKTKKSNVNKYCIIRKRNSKYHVGKKETNFYLIHVGLYHRAIVLAR